MSEKTEGPGIQLDESLDVFNYADIVVEKLQEHKGDDGKISGSEITSTMITTVPDAVKAVVGAGEVGDELKHLNDEERMIVATRGANLARALVALFTK
jgi:hypothetical protein